VHVHVAADGDHGRGRFVGADDGVVPEFDYRPVVQRYRQSVRPRGGARRRRQRQPGEDGQRKKQAEVASDAP